ncbi:MAG TPA: polyribonucleotide nucleotidyltransferase [Actinobacteria bacterium]|nr:polyribonucleotide nucleotidyltransferase [Actinomycetota bacterium]
MRVIKREIELGGKTISLETGKLARQANGAAVVRCEDTVVLVTAVASEKPLEGVDFLPLTVDIEAKMYAVGRIPGSFFRREGRPLESAILNARLIDRPLRPSFPSDFRHEIQIIATIFSVDQVNPPDVLALLGASAALTISDIPFQGPLGAVRIGRIGERWIINPTFQELDHSEMDIVVAGTRGAILMVEAGAKEVGEGNVLQALEEAQKSINKLIDFQEEFRSEVGTPKREVVPPATDAVVEQRVREYATDELRDALKSPDKLAREEAIALIEDEATERLTTMLEGKEHYIASVLDKIKKEEVRRMILEGEVRIDGRRPDEIRTISCEAGILPRPHGSGLFMRGQTAVLSILTLGTTGEEQRIDDLGVQETKRFMHHYNFPPFCTGDVGILRGPRRREIGHGALAERALLPLIPPEQDFPYTIRLVAEVLESNGSTSMASVCAGSLALMDGGVPMREHVAGIAMGLVKEGDKSVILTDILGVEDALGDMDFKVAGTAKGITALQMDMKIAGIGMDLLKEALEKAKEARLYILDRMNEAIAKPREELSEFAPRIVVLKISPEKIGGVIGPGGRMIRSIIEETGVTIDIEDDGTVFIASKDKMGTQRAREIVESITKEPKVGERYMGTVTKTTSFGAFVEILPGREGLVHISRLAKRRVPTVEDVVKTGDKLLVEIVDIDKQNRISLAAVDLGLGEAIKPRGEGMKSHTRRSRR